MDKKRNETTVSETANEQENGLRLEVRRSRRVRTGLRAGEIVDPPIRPTTHFAN